MKNNRFKKIVSTALLSTAVSSSLSGTSYASADWFGISEIFKMEHVKNFFESATDFMNKFKEADVKTVGPLLENFNKNFDEWSSKINLSLNAFCVLGYGLTTLVGMSVLGKAWNFGKYIFGFNSGKELTTFSDKFKEIEKKIDTLPVDEKLKLTIFTTLVQQFVSQGLAEVSIKCDKELAGKRVVLAGRGNSLVLKKLADDLREALGDAVCFPVSYVRVDSKQVTGLKFFEKVLDACDGRNEYSDKNGIFILDYDGDVDSDEKTQKLRDSCSRFYFEFGASLGRLACEILKVQVENLSKLLLGEKRVNITLGRDLILYAFNKYNKFNSADSYDEILKDVNAICGAALNLVKGLGEEGFTLFRENRNIVVDVNKDGDVIASLAVA